MASFPRISELPPVLETVGWVWEPFKAPSVPSHDFWVGTDRAGNRWLTKRRGDFYAYREFVFGRLAQMMNWSCQSTVFMRVDADSARQLGVKPDSIHGAHWLLEEHVHPPCNQGHDCALEPLLDREVRYVEDLQGLKVAHILDWPKSEIAACLFGANEPPGRLFTTTHEFVIIDSELMFSTRPQSFDCTSWWGNTENPRPSGVALAKEVCAEFSSLRESAVLEMLTPPAGISVGERWPISGLVQFSYEYAQLFCQE